MADGILQVQKATKQWLIAWGCEKHFGYLSRIGETGNVFWIPFHSFIRNAFLSRRNQPSQGDFKDILFFIHINSKTELFSYLSQIAESMVKTTLEKIEKKES